jgi:hypothetical protein
MNRRKAGEDFYFLNKFMTLGTFSELNATTVYPSARASHRVPFGTGRAMGAWLGTRDGFLESYNPLVFADLRDFLAKSDLLRGLDASGMAAFLHTLPVSMADFLAAAGFPARIAEIQRNSSTREAFVKRFFRWFDRFRVLKFVHFASDRSHPRIAVSEATARLLAWAQVGEMEDLLAASPAALLHHLRRMEREGAWLPFPPAREIKSG